MPGVPLIAAGGMEGDRTTAPGDITHATEESTEPASDGVRIGGSTRPSDEAERAEAAVGNVAPVPAPSRTAAVPGEDAAPVADEVVPAAADAKENVGGNASEMVHAAELEATLLAASSPGREGPPKPAAAEPATTPVVTADAEV
jgi:hypothetical protein